jgi:catechol-2,3-dioxygenase
MSTPSSPAISHIVLNVRDIDASHRFYTEMLGFVQCGTFSPDGDRAVDMRFYRSSTARHHDLALMQLPEPAASSPVPTWSMFSDRPGIAHLALAYGSRASWLEQIEHLQARGVEFHVRGNHGMTHSAYVSDPDGMGIEVLYDLPREVWEGDVDAALSYFEPLPRNGAAALQDREDYRVFGATE